MFPLGEEGESGEGMGGARTGAGFCLGWLVGGGHDPVQANLGQRAASEPGAGATSGKEEKVDVRFFLQEVAYHEHRQGKELDFGVGGEMVARKGEESFWQDRGTQLRLDPGGVFAAGFFMV